MRAVLIREPGGPEVLTAGDVARPVPGEHDVLVRVAATAVNRADILQRRARYPAPPGWPADIPGLEYAGRVEQVGAAVTRWKPGDLVMGLVGGGAYAEYVTVHEAEAMRVPSTLDLVQAAAIPEAFITAHDALLTQARLAPGETLLVHGVGSGVGTAAIQTAKAAGARVVGTARSAWKLERAAALGLDHGIDVSREAFPDAVLALTDGRGVDVVLDLIGGDYLPGNVRVLATHGRIVLVGVVAGAKAELDMRALMSRRATIRGTVLRSRTPAEKAAATAAFDAFATPLFAQGRLQPVIHTVLPLEQAAEAHRLIESNAVFGKVVLRVD